MIKRSKTWRKRVVLMALSLAGALAALAGALWWRRKQRASIDKLPRRVVFDAYGLTQAEAKARYQEGQSNAIHLYPVQTRAEMIRKNAFTVFNTGLVAIIGVQMLLGKFLDALVSFGVLLFTIGVNVFQEEFARMRIRKVQEAAQPRVVVIREGKVRSIEPDSVVVGDLVEFKAGDLIMVDGRMLQGAQVMVDETLVLGQGKKAPKKPGDELFAGSMCLNGRGLIETTRIGEDRFIARRLKHRPPPDEGMTPIERLIDRVLKWLLGFVLAIAAFLLVQYFQLDTVLPQEMVDKFIDAIGVIFSIAPAGLFFMISLTYAASTVDLANLHVLVHRARVIETLAQIDILFLSKAGFIMGRWLELTPLQAKGKKDLQPSELELRKLLGTYARSISDQNQFTRTMQVMFEGLQLPPVEEAPFFAHYGWSGIRLESEDVRGVLALVAPHLLEADIMKAGDGREESEIVHALSRTKDRLGRLFRRAGSEKTREEGQTNLQASSPAEPQEPSIQIASAPDPERKTGIWRRMRRSVTKVMHRKPEEGAKQPQGAEGEQASATLIFAWSPEPRPLYDEAGNPRLPDQLIPLCQLAFQERVNPAAAQALQAFSANGVASKLFDEGPAEAIREALRQAGAEETLAAIYQGISAEDLEGLADEELAEAIIRHHLFGHVQGDFMVRAVRALRKTGHLVGVLGASASELDAMMASDLGITLLSASSGALSIADIVLMDASPNVIHAMIDKGQRIVNGLLDVLKLYLTQAFYLLVLVAALLVFLQRFPYRGAQGGLIAVFAISVPAIALTLTAQPGRLRTKHVSAALFAFAVPASITIALTGFFLFAHFLRVYGDADYAQIALVHALIAMGLLLAIMLRPPLALRKDAIPIRFQYFLPTLVSLVSGGAFLLLTFIPLAQKFLYITPLKSSVDYMVVGGASLLWGVLFGAYVFVHQYGQSWLRSRPRWSQAPPAAVRDHRFLGM